MGTQALLERGFLLGAAFDVAAMANVCRSPTSSTTTSCPPDVAVALAIPCESATGGPAIRNSTPGRSRLPVPQVSPPGRPGMGPCLPRRSAPSWRSRVPQSCGFDAPDGVDGEVRTAVTSPHRHRWLLCRQPLIPRPRMTRARGEAFAGKCVAGHEFAPGAGLQACATLRELGVQ